LVETVCGAAPPRKGASGRRRFSRPETKSSARAPSPWSQREIQGHHRVRSAARPRAADLPSALAGRGRVATGSLITLMMNEQCQAMETRNRPAAAFSWSGPSRKAEEVLVFGERFGHRLSIPKTWGRSVQRLLHEPGTERQWGHGACRSAGRSSNRMEDAYWASSNDGRRGTDFPVSPLPVRARGAGVRGRLVRPWSRKPQRAAQRPLPVVFVVRRPTPSVREAFEQPCFRSGRPAGSSWFGSTAEFLERSKRPDGASCLVLDIRPAGR